MRLLIAAAVGILAVAASCSPDLPRAFEGSDPEDRGPTVAVSLPALADVVRQVVGDFGSVLLVGSDGPPVTLDPSDQDAIASSDLVLVHGLEGEMTVVAAASEGDAERPVRVEQVNAWVDPEPVNAAVWFDPIAMARITLELGEVLADVDDDNVRTRADWRAAAAGVATTIAATFDQAEELMATIPVHCRRASGGEALLEHLGQRFGLRPAADDDTGAADLRDVELGLAQGDSWQDWFLALIERAALADPGCAAPSPDPSASPT